MVVEAVGEESRIESRMAVAAVVNNNFLNLFSNFFPIIYKPIRELYNIMNEYISRGERVIVNIPFPEIKKNIEGILSVNVKEEVWLRLNNI